MMNIKNLHQSEKPVSAVPLFKNESGVLTSLQILKDGELKEHLTKVPALLICVSGSVLFENENGAKEKLKSGDYYQIEPMVKHWVTGVEDSELLLMK